MYCGFILNYRNLATKVQRKSENNAYYAKIYNY